MKGLEIRVMCETTVWVCKSEKHSLKMCPTTKIYTVPEIEHASGQCTTEVGCRNFTIIQHEPGIPWSIRRDLRTQHNIFVFDEVVKAKRLADFDILICNCSFQRLFHKTMSSWIMFISFRFILFLETTIHYCINQFHTSQNHNLYP
jgi:hypothetical protein